ncbi:MAG: diguanylate cyclase [Chitinivibrionales bacterium]|nr:diguanylate cyclase [Chitinivibrionales bacterium]
MFGVQACRAQRGCLHDARVSVWHGRSGPCSPRAASVEAIMPVRLRTLGRDSALPCRTQRRGGRVTVSEKRAGTQSANERVRSAHEVANARDGEPGFGMDELQRLQVMHRVGPHSVWGLLEHCPLITLAPNETIIKAGRVNQTMYLILSGSLGIHLEENESEPLAVLKAGETVGELSVIDDRPASATVVSRTEARLLAIDESTFWRLAEASHEFATNMLLMLAQRLRGTNSNIAQHIRQRRQSEHEARLDGLTGLHNRRWLEETLPRVVARHQRDGRPCVVIMVDIDHFKEYNDTYGHPAGDRVLAIASRVMSSNVRPTDLIARYGGEEFLVILPDTDLVGARAAAARLRDAVGRSHIRTTEGVELPPVTISLGAALLRDGQSAEALVQTADTALYKAKRNGRNRVEIAE